MKYLLSVVLAVCGTARLLAQSAETSPASTAATSAEVQELREEVRSLKELVQTLQQQVKTQQPAPEKSDTAESARRDGVRLRRRKRLTLDRPGLGECTGMRLIAVSAQAYY